jgi:UDP-N-acetylglucosamine--N-acetylmuramyl-(pentapeptide) pyrophosphoryl-undecaprenol N-acetylglucosamine transferase
LADADAAILLIQSEFNEISLIKAIENIKGSLQAMSTAVKNKAKLDATAVVANICIEEANK